MNSYALLYIFMGPSFFASYFVHNDPLYEKSSLGQRNRERERKYYDYNIIGQDKKQDKT